MTQTIVRHVIRIATVATGFALGSMASPALAAPPSDWETTEGVSTLQYLMLFIGFPLAIAAVIFFLTYLPSMMKGRSAEPALVFQEKKEWFGGPRKGLDEKSDDDASANDTGGAGARW